jgi:hypothetical protein
MIHAGTRRDILNSRRRQPDEIFDPMPLLKTTDLFNDHLETILIKFLWLTALKIIDRSGQI